MKIVTVKTKHGQTYFYKLVKGKKIRIAKPKKKKSRSIKRTHSPQEIFFKRLQRTQRQQSQLHRKMVKNHLSVTNNAARVPTQYYYAPLSANKNVFKSSYVSPTSKPHLFQRRQDSAQSRPHTGTISPGSTMPSSSEDSDTHGGDASSADSKESDTHGGDASSTDSEESFRQLEHSEDKSDMGSSSGKKIQKRIVPRQFTNSFATSGTNRILKRKITNITPAVDGVKKIKKRSILARVVNGFPRIQTKRQNPK